MKEKNVLESVSVGTAPEDQRVVRNPMNETDDDESRDEDLTEIQVVPGDGCSCGNITPPQDEREGDGCRCGENNSAGRGER